MRDRLWHRLLKRGGDYFMTARYALRPRPLLFVVDGAADAEALRPLFLELQATYPPATGGAALPLSATTGGALRESSALSAPQRPPRVVLTGRGGTAITCAKAAVALGNAQSSGPGPDATLCNWDAFAAAWDLVAGRHFPREGTGRAGGSGGRDHVLMADLATGLAGTVETLQPLAIVSVAGSGVSAGPGGEGAGGAAIDEALAVVSGQSGVPVIRLPRRAQASGAALWLSRLTPSAFGAWHKASLDILVVFNPASGAAGERGYGHTEAQLKTLLDSLSTADYLGDGVDITVAVGSGPVPDAVVGDSLSWPRGRKVVRAPIHAPRATTTTTTETGSKNGDGGGGTPATVALRAWMPRDDHHFVVVLEADRVVSRLFYSWLKVAVLETSYGGGRQASARAEKGGVCVPGGADRGDSSWMFPPGSWRAAQASCFGSGAGGGERACDVEGYLRPPEHSVCPSLKEPSEALVARTGADGKVLRDAGRLMENGKALANLVRRIFFAQPEVGGWK